MCLVWGRSLQILPCLSLVTSFPNQNKRPTFMFNLLDLLRIIRYPIFPIPNFRPLPPTTLPEPINQIHIFACNLIPLIMRYDIVLPQRQCSAFAPAGHHIPRHSPLCQMIQTTHCSRQDVRIQITRAPRNPKSYRFGNRCHSGDQHHGVQSSAMSPSTENGRNGGRVDVEEGIRVCEEDE